MKKIRGITTLVMFISLLVGSSAVIASPVTYVVKSGDSLWSIASANGISVDTIKQLNGLNSDLIYLNQILTLSNQEVIQSVTPSPATVSQSEYIIQTGDSLWSIAQKFGTTVDCLKDINSITNDTIYVGNTLMVCNTSISTTISRSGNCLTGSSVVTKAEQYLGSPYEYGGTSPDGFDCSGFTQYVYSQFQIPLDRTAASQYTNGIAVSKTNLVPGDLVFFNTNSGINHVGIYAGDGKFIHSSSGQGKVVYSNLNDEYYTPRYVGARRIIK